MPIFLIPIIVVLAIFCLTALVGAPYVPSRNKEIREAFTKLYKLSKNDLLIDLGSGDGKVLKAASECGASSIGIELNPILVFISKLRLRKDKNASVYCRDYFHFDFPAETTVVYLFSEDRDTPKIVNYIEKQATKIGHPIYLISYAFEAEKYKSEKNYRAYYLYKIKETK